MKYVQEYREGELVRGVMAEIRRAITRPVGDYGNFAGGQTHAIMRYGLDQLLPNEIELVHGPGCPVCVTLTGVNRQGPGDCQYARCDLCILWGYAARPWFRA